MKNEQNRILVVPVPAVGHVNACIGITEPLLKRGHRIAFFVEETFKDKLRSKGFEEFIYEPFFEPDEEENGDKEKKKYKNPGDALAQILMEKGILGKRDIESQIKNLLGSDEKGKFKQKQIIRHNKLKEVIEEFQPDLFIVDDLSLDPAIHYSIKPWIKIMSVVPLIFLHDVDELPPSWTGFASNSDREQWPKFKQMMKKLIFDEKFNNTLQELGYDRYENDMLMPESEALAVYAFPEEYDYPQSREKNEKWFNVEVFNKNKDQETVDLEELLPKEFYQDDLDGKFSGKWIYVSMGSMGSVDLELMDRLIKTLARTNHKYIVSKGPRHEEYELERNLWGDRYLPQTKILPLVDLVITHGGNNSVTETFAQGKPMIIMPLFCDQHDNAQRLSEVGLAKKLLPYEFEEQQLLDSIEQLLNDEDLKQRLTKASKRIQKSNKHEQFCDLVEQILDKAKNFSNGTRNGIH